jgi:hypothetical protein
MVLGRRAFIARCKPFSKKPSHTNIYQHISVLSTLSRLLHDSKSNKQSMIAQISLPLMQAISPKLIATQSVISSNRLTSQYILQYISDSIRYFNRIVAYIIYGTPLLFLTPLTLSLGQCVPWVEDVVWDYCLWSVLQLGPTFIKMAQWVRINIKVTFILVYIQCLLYLRHKYISYPDHQ